MVALAHAAQNESNPELGDAWRVQKVYFNQDLSARKFLAIHRLIEAEGGESPFAEQLEWFAKRDEERHTWLTARVHCGEFFAVRDEALISHATQIDPNGGFFSGGRAAARKHWLTEEFELAEDHTGRAPLDRSQDFVESDLFAGVTDDDGDAVPDDLMPEAVAPPVGGSSARGAHAVGEQR